MRKVFLNRCMRVAHILCTRLLALFVLCCMLTTAAHAQSTFRITGSGTLTETALSPYVDAGVAVSYDFTTTIDGSAATATGTMTIDGRALPVTGLTSAFSNTTQAVQFQDFLGPLTIGTEVISLGRMVLFYPNDGLGSYENKLLAASTRAVPFNATSLWLQRSYSGGSSSSYGTVSMAPATVTDITPTTAQLVGPDVSTDGQFQVQIALSHDSTDFTVDDLELTNATATLTGSGDTYVAILTPIATGAVSVFVPAGRFSRASGIASVADSNTYSTSFSSDGPFAYIAALVKTSNTQYTADIELSAPSTDFTADGLVLNNGTATLAGSGTSYVATITPAIGGDVSLTIGVGTFSDATGAPNTLATNTVSVDHDATAPTAVISAFTNIGGNFYTATVVLSEPLTGVLNSGKFTVVQNGTTVPTRANRRFLNQFTKTSDTTYSFRMNARSDVDYEVYVTSGRIIDTAGNVSTAASNIARISRNASAPTIDIGAFTGPINGEQEAQITLSHDSTDFTLSDLNLTNATATLTGSGANYSAVLTGLSDGDIKLSVDAGAFSDGTSRFNLASNEVISTYDATLPLVVLSTTTSEITGASTFDVTAVFSEVVTGFTADDVVATNGSVTTVSGSGTTYTISIAATGGGTVVVSIPAGVAIDAAGNGNAASNTLSVISRIVEKTQKIINQFMHSRANQLVAHQPDLSGLLDGSGPASFNASVSRGVGTFDYYSAQNSDSTVWVQLNGSSSTEGSSDARYFFGALGTTARLSDSFVFGAMLQFDHMNQTDGAASVQGTGWLVGPYFVARAASQPLVFEGRLLFGQTTNDISPFGTYTDRFDSDRMLAQFKVQGEMNYGATRLTPNLKMSYTTDEQNSYVDSLGNVIPEQGISLGQLAFGLNFATPARFYTGDGALILTGGLSGIGSYSKASGLVSTFEPSYEGFRGRIDLGADYTAKNGAHLNIEAYYDGIYASGYESYGVQLGAGWTF